jgi:hypothetical protein
VVARVRLVDRPASPDLSCREGPQPSNEPGVSLHEVAAAGARYRQDQPGEAAVVSGPDRSLWCCDGYPGRPESLLRSSGERPRKAVRSQWSWELPTTRPSGSVRNQEKENLGAEALKIIPPLARTFCPVIQRASPLTRRATRSVMSSGSTSLPIAVIWANRRLSCSVFSCPNNYVSVPAKRR